MSQITVPISIGELLDKITILQIKAERIDDEAKKRNVSHELQLLQATADQAELDDAVVGLTDQLREINTELWDIEDEIRLCERDGDFGARFIELARAVYQTNDRRAAVKKEINLACGSELVEEKSYQPY